MIQPHMLARLACIPNGSQQRCISLAVPLFRPYKLLCKQHLQQRARNRPATAANMHISIASDIQHPQSLTPSSYDRPKSSRLDDTANYCSVVRFHTAHTSSPSNTVSIFGSIMSHSLLISATVSDRAATPHLPYVRTSPRAGTWAP